MSKKTITVRCEECGELLTAERSDYLLKKRRKHILSCHKGFEEIHNDYKDEEDNI